VFTPPCSRCQRRNQPCSSSPRTVSATSA
jgi:hypothetical protein